MEKFFNTAGPCDPGRHYMLPPEPRLPDARRLIERGQYFVVHAPRQTGKTTTLRALAEKINEGRQFVALHFSCETAESAKENYAAAQRAVIGAIERESRIQLAGKVRPPFGWPAPSSEQYLAGGLTAWAKKLAPRRLVLFFDEIDALHGESLQMVLRQLRDGYISRPEHFPWSVVLCGLRDVRDYKAASGGDPTRLGTSSPFNIKVESLRLGDFTKSDMWALYTQHTNATGQKFTTEALERAYEYSGGQPWLVNALAHEIVDQLRVPLEMSITDDRVDEAKKRLILARATHLDSLAALLQERRVRRVLAPLIAGDVVPTEDTYDDDVAYLRDLGLLAPGRPIRIANPIYREVIPRVLGARAKDIIVDDPQSFVRPDGLLDFEKLLLQFTHFWRQHGEVLVHGATYPEAAAQLIIMAYLDRVAGSGGHIDREYSAGRGRIDLLIRWPYEDAHGKRKWQREAVEIKVQRYGRPNATDEGLYQLDEYLARLGLDSGTLVVFAGRPGGSAPAQGNGFERKKTPAGREVLLLRL